jgi:4-amino-4-deoxy-L-arabinose transferase-like glycosyltransferase
VSAARRWAWWPGIVLAALVTALATGWGIARDPLEPYYAASVRAMASNWHAFWFGAFDPAATVTMDKLPGAFWVQALLVRALGPAPWVMVAPQVVEMTAAVVVLALAVRALAGPTAGTVAAVVLALSPAAVAVGRGNVADPLMILALVAATWATARAITGRPGRAGAWLALAGVFVGLAFQAKMAAAWLVLPALAVAFLVAGPGACHDGSARRRRVASWPRWCRWPGRSRCRRSRRAGAPGWTAAPTTRCGSRPSSTTVSGASARRTRCRCSRGRGSRSPRPAPAPGRPGTAC